ncbi:MAG: hypothetical protein ACJARG_001567 [Arcticibacterium sp.]|jgi:hypothetical protein
MLFFASLVGCKDSDDAVIPEPLEPKKKLLIKPDLAIKWADLAITTLKESPENSPTYASRSLGYIGLTMYESIAKGSFVYQSITEGLNGLGKTPSPDSSQSLDWELALNAGQFEIIKLLYPHALLEVSNRWQTLYKEILAKKTADSVAQETIEISDLYGKLIARQIFEWSKLDKGHEGYKITFDRAYNYPRGFGYWSPPSFGQSSIAAPMHPYWGENRTFIKTNSERGIPAFVLYSTNTSGSYFKEMKQVYDINNNLSQEQKEIALWWGDDPTESASPPGHSYYLAKLLVEEKQTNLFEAASVFAKVGMSVADAFINVWKCKYTYHSERPTIFINRNIDNNYSQFWPEPPFPGFTSGHSTQAAAAATVLIGVFGDDNTITDNFHSSRATDVLRNVDYKPRTFNTIWAFAEECGWSRILGGIHMSQDNLRGLEEGKHIGENINMLPWKIQ